MNPDPSLDVGAALPGGDRATATWIEVERHMIAMLARGVDLTTILEGVARSIERALPGHRASILRLGAGGAELVLATAPNLPREYAAALERLPIGEGIGSCGTAAFRRERVVTEDIAVDPSWAPARELTARHGLRSCWSQPILGSDGALLGVFGLYQSVPGAPGADEIAHIEVAAHLVGLAIERDRSERAHRLHEAIFAELTDSVMVIDGDLRIVECNPATERMFGWTRAELVGKSPLVLYPEGQRSRELFDEIVEHVRRNDRWQGVRPFQTQDGRTGTRVLTVARFDEPVGGEPGYLAISRDITEERRAALEREDLRVKMLQTQKLESLGILAGGIAHDFNNLLTGVLGNADLALEDEQLSAETRTALIALRRSASRAADLTRQMLAYAGRASFERSVVDLTAELREIGTLIASSISKKVELRFDLAADLPSIEADRAQLQQLVMNLVINAAEAIGDGVGQVIVSTAARAPSRRLRNVQFPADGLPAGSYALLEVRDDGCGMDEFTLQRIFDPFFTTKFTGRGLGLAAVLGIVRAHGGGLQVESEPGRGTTFRVFLPVSDKACAAGADDDQVKPALDRAVLVIDDEPAVVQFAVSALARAGLRALSALSGEQAVTLFERHRDDVEIVLLDMTMPRMGAREILDALRRHRPEVKVLLTSGYSEDEVARQFAAGEFEGFLQKPYTPRELFAALRAALAAR